jgi:pimeloyl-ACP methyl ester carboxylesterase
MAAGRTGWCTVSRRRVPTNGVELDVTEAGDPDDPVVVLVHGFPESSHSWRHQIEPLVAAGYRVLAPDQRGYGASSAPTEVDAYRSDHLSGDLIGLLDDVEASDALFVGHDWGALVVWDLARLHPDRVRGVVNVSVPYTAWPAPPTDLFRAASGDRFFYILYFQPVGPAEAELEADIVETMRLTLWGGSGEMFGPPSNPLPPMEESGFLQSVTRGAAVPDGLPSWITSDEFDVYVEQFTTSGFFGPLSWYRNLDADYEITKDLDAPAMPTAFIGGSRDGVIAGRPEYVEAMASLLPDFRGAILIEGAGHWTQQERPGEFNAALIELLARLD